MTTKERIVDEALSLFAVKGYNGTSVKNIADAVGIKDSSLYKHFKSKRAILDRIVETILEHIGEMSEAFGLPDDVDIEGAADIYTSFDEERLVEFSRRIFLFYLKDSYVSRFWQMGNIEQYQNPEVCTVFRKLFLEDSISYQTALFAEMKKRGGLNGPDAQAMAIYFYAPIFFLLSKYAGAPEKEEEALAILGNQVREFYRIYGSKA